jgi:uncharacterized membrane protein YjfL (UPF0719 family)
MFEINTLQLIYTIASVLLCTGLVLLAKAIWSKLSPFDADHELTTADNPAVGVALFGYLGGLLIVLASLLAATEPTDDPMELAWNLGEILAFGLLSIVLLKLSAVINDRLILHRFENKKELVTDRNVGAGAVLCGSYLASGLVIAGAFGGQVAPDLIAEDAGHLATIGHEMLVALAFYGIGQLALVLFGQIYQRAQKNDVLGAIEADYEKDGIKHGGNAAAGVAFGGNLAALGLVMWGGAHHDFIGWTENLITLGMATALGVVLLPLWRLVVDHVMLRKADLAHEIFVDRNLNAALVEVVTVAGLAMVLALSL